MTKREQELIAALQEVAATGDYRTARLAKEVLRLQGREPPFLYRSGLAGEVDNGFAEIERSLGRGTTSADIVRYADALNGHYAFRTVETDYGVRWASTSR